jgi:hypothetical protein
MILLYSKFVLRIFQIELPYIIKILMDVSKAVYIKVKHVFIFYLIILIEVLIHLINEKTH